MSLESLLALGAAIILVLLALGIAWYVLHGISHYKALKKLGYERAWFAWIPYASEYACADVVTKNDGDKVKLIGSLEIPTKVFKFWWVAIIVLPFLPIGWLATFLSVAICVLCNGLCYTRMFAALDGKSEQEEQTIGYISGAITIIAVIKFLIAK